MAKSVLEKAMDHLALRPLSTNELRTKLSSSGKYTPDEVDEAIDICRTRGYLNDSLLAADAAQFLNACGKGRNLIRKKLRTRGISEEELSEALEKLTPENESAAARSAFLRTPEHRVTVDEIDQRLWNGQGSKERLHSTVRRLRNELKSAPIELSIEYLGNAYQLKIAHSIEENQG